MSLLAEVTMSHDITLLTRAALPARAAGYQGAFGPAPLWYAAVSLRVAPFDVERHGQLACQLPDGAGPFAQALSLSYRWPAADFASSYGSILRRACGAARFVEGVYDGAVAPEAEFLSLEQLERALFEADLEALSRAESRPKPWELALSDDEFLAHFGRARAPLEATPDALLVVRPGKLAEVEALLAGREAIARCTSLFDWARLEPTRLTLLAARCPPTLRLSQLTHLVTPATDDALWEDERLMFALLDRCFSLAP